ncbi:ATP cone domain-containing protein, partial [Aquabacterium sp. UBA2148]|uniref:ATP cone domain-containing protein n=1 Tax=Aquabacterium sp. UBA2148 TaxID=1946042 RepID=UPI00257C86DF
AGFQPERIARAMAAAGDASNAFDVDEAWRLTDAVIQRLSVRVPTVEQIQDVVEQVLLDAGHTQAARAYIVYREQHRALREDRRTAVDVERSVNEYLHRQDWRIHANANQG